MTYRKQLWVGVVAVAAVVLVLSSLGLGRDRLWSKVGRARAELTRLGARVTEQRVMAGPGFGTARVYVVDFSGVALTDAQLAAAAPWLQNLGGVRLLNLRNTQVGDNGLQNLAAVGRLYVVDVTGAQTTPAGVAKLRAQGAYPHVIDNSGPSAVDFQTCEDLLFSPDGRLLVVAGRDRTDVWNIQTRQRVAQAPGGTSAAFSPDSQRVAVAQVQGAVVWDLPKNQQQASLPMQTQSAASVAFSADQRFLYVAEADTHQFDLKTGALVGTQAGLLLGRSHNVAGLGLDQQVATMLHPDRGAVRGTLTGVPGQIRLGVVSADGTRAAWMPDPAYNAVAPATIHIVDLTTGVVAAQIVPPPGLYLSGSFDAAARRLAVGGSGQGKSDGTLLVYDVATGKQLLSVADPAGSTTKVALSEDGRQVAAAFEYGSVKWWAVPEPGDAKP